MTTYRMTITPVGSATPDWVLRYSPDSATPFVTISGSEEVWVWDFIGGALMKGGEVLTNHTITISIWEAD
jgi:hypothetical protein